MKPTYEQLEQQLQRAQHEISKLKNLLQASLERIAKLETQINRNSKNSPKPPSTDQKGNTSKNTRKTRKSRSGKFRPLFPQDRVDKHVTCTQDVCPHCKSVSIRQQGKPPFIWQQVELPQAAANVTQFNCQKYYCRSCGNQSVAPLPEGIPFSAFGPKLMALVATLTGRFHMAKREALSLSEEGRQNSGFSFYFD